MWTSRDATKISYCFSQYKSSSACCTQNIHSGEKVNQCLRPSGIAQRGQHCRCETQSQRLSTNGPESWVHLPASSVWPDSVSVFLSWETAHKIKVLDAVKKLEGLEAGHKRKLSISLLFCGTRTLQSTAHSHSSYLPRLPFPNLPDPWRNLSFQPWAEANWRLSKAFLNRVILGSAWKHPHSQEMSSVDTALTWAALWSSAATDVLGPNTD